MAHSVKPPGTLMLRQCWVSRTFLIHREIGKCSGAPKLLDWPNLAHFLEKKGIGRIHWNWQIWFTREVVHYRKTRLSCSGLWETGSPLRTVQCNINPPIKRYSSEKSKDPAHMGSGNLAVVSFTAETILKYQC